jgi:hypothetical protein
VTWYKVSHFRKTIDNHKNDIPPPLWSRQSLDKVRRNILPRHTRNRKRHIKIMWVKSRLSFVVSRTPRHIALHVAPHFWPKEVSGQYILCFLHSKMSHQTTSICFLQKQKVNGISWNTQFVSKVQKTVMQHIFISHSPLSMILISIFEIYICSIQLFNRLQTKKIIIKLREHGITSR